TGSDASACGLTLAEAVDDRAVAGQSLLELPQALLDATPARGDEVDEECEIVDARMALGQDVALDPFEPADDLIREPPYFCEGAGPRPEMLAQPVLDSPGQPRLEPCGRRGERLDGFPRPLQRRVEGGGVGTAGGGVLDALLRPGDRVHVHEADGTTAVGWNSSSSTTSCRRS